MNTYEFARLVPAAWSYDEFSFTVVLSPTLLAAFLLLALTVRSTLRSFAARPSPDAPSLPATPVKPRLV